jgi:hypothetical protein
MRKIRILSAALAVLLLLPLVTSCSKSVKEPKGHNMGAWTVESEPTYKKKGKLVRHCTDEGCSYSQSYKTKSTKVNYEVTEDGKIYVSGKKSSKTSFVYIDSVTPEGKKVDGLADFAFFDDTTIRYAYIEDGITEIGSYTFAGCSNLVEAHLPASCELFDFCHFLACTSLKRVNLPENMTSLPDQIFEGCESLEEVVLPSGLKSIGASSFILCSSLKSIDFPRGVEVIGSNAFSGCTSLTEVSFPESMKTIYDNAFLGCDGLKEVVLPKNLEMLRELAFAYCTGLEKVYIPSTVVSINVNTGFSPFNFCDKDLLLITDAEKRPEGWSPDFNVYHIGETETDDPAEGFLYLQVVYGSEIPQN